MINRRKMLLAPLAVVGAMLVSTSAAAEPRLTGEGKAWLESFLPHQQKWLISKERFANWSGPRGRRGGTTWTATARAAMLATRGESVIFVTTGYGAEQASRYLYQHAQKLWPTGWKFDRATRTLHFKNGGLVKVVLPEPEQLMGLRGHVILDNFKYYADKDSVYIQANSMARNHSLVTIYHTR